MAEKTYVQNLHFLFSEESFFFGVKKNSHSLTFFSAFWPKALGSLIRVSVLVAYCTPPGLRTGGSSTSFSESSPSGTFISKSSSLLGSARGRRTGANPEWLPGSVSAEGTSARGEGFAFRILARGAMVKMVIRLARTFIYTKRRHSKLDASQENSAALSVPKIYRESKRRFRRGPSHTSPPVPVSSCHTTSFEDHAASKNEVSGE
jgi:hypothetical protein